MRRLALLALVTLAACSANAAGTEDAATNDATVVDGAFAHDTSGGSDTGGTCPTPDADGDGEPSTACGGNDCDDRDAMRFPGNAEVCDAADRDEDCDATTFGSRDEDADGHTDIACCNGTTCGSDCDDSRPGVHFDAPEVCNGLDDDCDEAIDETVFVLGYVDADGDGFGSTAVAPAMVCAGAPGYSILGSDCLDSDVDVHPGAEESCDARDEDCDGLTDEGAASTYYLDDDDDGYGVDSTAVMACTAPPRHSLTSGDCDDTMDHVYPTAPELCDRIDDDCDAAIDEMLDALAFGRPEVAETMGGAPSWIGGTIVPGTYHLTSYTVYSPGVATAALHRWTLILGADGTYLEIVENGSGGVDRQGGRWIPMGNSFNRLPGCGPFVPSPRSLYIAGSGSLRLGSDAFGPVDLFFERE